MSQDIKVQNTKSAKMSKIYKTLDLHILLQFVAEKILVSIKQRFYPRNGSINRNIDILLTLFLLGNIQGVPSILFGSYLRKYTS